MKFLRTLIIFAAVALISSCRGPEYRTARGGVWNTLYNITYQSDRDLDDSIMAVMRRVEMSLSPFAGESLISRINRGDTVVADSLVTWVFLESKLVNALSDGAFDPTVAPLVNLWGFGYKPGDPEPSQQKIDSLLALVGIDSCRLEGDMIVKKHPLTEFNFSAITKGYGCDLVGEMLSRNGVANYLVEIGGEIAARGVSQRGRKWRVGIDAPSEENGVPRHDRLTTIEITDCGVATSGNYRNWRETGQGKAWHTISPTTGRPALTDLLSATVIAPTCMLADALATACMAMNEREALEMIEGLDGVECILVTKKGVTRSKGANRIAAGD